MRAETTFQNREKNIAWVDVLRVLACFMVVFAHCSGRFMAQSPSSDSAYLAVITWGSFMRPCVPLFAMITGFLLFPITTSTTEFYSKRIKKIVIPLIFWSLITPFFYFGYFAFFEATNPNIVLENFSLNATLIKLYTFVFNFSHVTIPLWYLYMLIGLYLVMPIFGAWLNQATQKELKVFLMLWGVTMILPLVEMFAPLAGYKGNYNDTGLLGECLWNPYGTFYYFSGFIGYAVLAYYLKTYPLNWTWTKTLCITIPLYIIGYGITYYGFSAVVEGYFGERKHLDTMWYYTGINVFMMTISIYLVIQKIKFRASKSLSRLAGLTMGIFLCHFFFVQVVYDTVYPILSVWDISPYLEILMVALTVFVLVAGIVWCLSKNKFTKKII